jgi:molybdate transport system regulatory protein
MKTSARNALKGFVTGIHEGAVNAEVTLRTPDNVEIVAIVTRESLADLGLKTGLPVTALIKSSFVILVAGDAPLKTSARNQLVGTVVSHTPGVVNDEVVLQVGARQTITAVITHGSGQALGLVPGSPAQALIKAPHVILAVD